MIFTVRTILLAATAAVALVTTTEGHGYVSISRSKKCQEGSNTGCGNIIYEPQSLEATKGFPSNGPADGKLASAGVALFSELDQQTSTRWHKTSATSQSSVNFQWFFTAFHKSTKFEYFITRSDWNPNSPLTRSQFESTPFCSANAGGQPPQQGTTHNCMFPSRSGYHVVYAVWTIDDTAMAFYNAIDLDFGGVGGGGGGGGGSTGSLGDWEFCSSNSQCRNGCCSSQWSNDGKLKCTPGGTICVGTGGGASLGEWEFCSSSAQCRNGCCSNQYSDDGKLKCTPGSNQCV